MNKWLKLPIVLFTGPFVFIVFILAIFPLLIAASVYIVLSSAGFFNGGDPDKLPLWLAFVGVEKYFDWLDSL